MTFITTIQRKKLVVKISYFYNTDHSVYEIETNNVYEDLYMIKDMFAFSEYPNKSKFLWCEKEEGNQQNARWN